MCLGLYVLGLEESVGTDHNTNLVGLPWAYI